MKVRNWGILITGLLVLGALAPEPEKPAPKKPKVYGQGEAAPVSPAAVTPEPRATPPTLEVTPYPGRATPAPTPEPVAEVEPEIFAGDVGDWISVLAATKAHKRDRSGRPIPITVPMGVTRQVLEANEKAVRIDEGWVLRQNLRANIVSGGPVFTPLPVVMHTPVPRVAPGAQATPWKTFYRRGDGGGWIPTNWNRDEQPPDGPPEPGLEWVRRSKSGRTAHWRHPKKR